ncbi:hypothetical protein SAMN05421848_2737 [Kushneria avicenniae]|uniref:Uncharacterized protein n=1 Tax=Kushneria avicenniae TaxID=402385 RepID=A0A1I1M1S5_9GAMM|nr:hypothetical protein [Kushneria avicenniae]SFC79324.1 hypothetical protein SAMN05421848_2737 [Kushneria avicenniae]
MDFEKMDAALAAAEEYTKTDEFKHVVKTMLMTKLEIERFMPANADDPRYVIVSGHLLIEKLFEEFVRSNLKRPEMIDGKEINYRQLVAFAQAMQAEDVVMPWMYKAMKILALLRDLYAHNLTPDNGEKQINKFITLVNQNRTCEKVAIEGEYEELASAIVNLCLLLSGLLKRS